MKKMLLTLPEELVDHIRIISSAKTKSQAVVIALKEYIRERKIGHLLSRFGKGFGLNYQELLNLRKKDGVRSC